jgi:hypothetical protein
MPPVALVAFPPADVSPNAEAFVRKGSPTIHVITSSPAFRQARCENSRTLLKLASVLAHEEWHVHNGLGERGAYEAQLHTLLRLGATLQSSVYRGVYRSMRTVLREHDQAGAARRATEAPDEKQLASR